LNDNLLQGPDLTNNLITVLLRFRQDVVGVVADIKQMFYQVRVQDEDRDAFRFLWFPDGDLNQHPAEFRMNVHIFGSTSSPSVAAFALRKTATDNLTNADSETVRIVLNNFYVDDLCVSFSSNSEAINRVGKLTKLLNSGGFCLTKFLSNSQEFLDSILPDDHALNIMNVENHDLPLHKTLGVYWDARNDQLHVKVKLKIRPCTRRGLLSMIHQTYDSLGVLATFILIARKLLQEACSLGLSWDEPFPSER